MIIGSKVQCQNCIFAHICKTAIIFGLLSRKKNVFEGHFLCDLYHFIVWFHVKKIPQDFCKLQMCKCFFCKNTEYQTSHKTKVSIVLPICTFMFKSRFFFELLNSFTLYSDCKKPIYEKLSWTRPSMRALACMWHYENALCM